MVLRSYLSHQYSINYKYCHIVVGPYTQDDNKVTNNISHHLKLFVPPGFVLFPEAPLSILKTQEIKRSHDSSLTPADFDLGGKFTKDASLGEMDVPF